jgi:hypothetical protein
MPTMLKKMRKPLLYYATFPVTKWPSQSFQFKIRDFHSAKLEEFAVQSAL